MQLFPILLTVLFLLHDQFKLLNLFSIYKLFTRSNKIKKYFATRNTTEAKIWLLLFFSGPTINNRIIELH